MPLYVEVAVNVPQVSGTFHYHLPPELEGRIQPGHLVEVPFGRQRVQGVVFRFVSQPEVAETRPLLAMTDEQTVLTSAQMALAEALAEETLAPLAACLALMLPPGIGQQADTLYTPRPAANAGKPLGTLQTRLLKLLDKHGPLRGRQIDTYIRRVDWRSAAQGLVRRGLLETEAVLPQRRARAKTLPTAQLACPHAVAEAALPDLARKGSPALERRQKMLRYLLQEGGPVQAAWLYAESGGSMADLQALAKRGLVQLGQAETWRDPLANLGIAAHIATTAEAPPLTADQQQAWAQVQAGLQAAAKGQAVKPYLLHGVTGSGKTEIYLHAVAEALRLGRQAIVLVPEIALTPQTVRRFMARFPGQVGILHSQLSEGERYDTWRRARQGHLQVMVGPRSALFTPFANPGLIVLDEFHDDSFYQSEMQPAYHARTAAVLYASLTSAVCLLGSATPDVVSRTLAERGEWHYLSLPQRILAHRAAIQEQIEKLNQAAPKETIAPSTKQDDPNAVESLELPPVSVVDMRQELQAGNRSIFSRALQEALHATLDQGQQAVLFLNRRGAATYIFCRDCGYIVRCPRCDLPLTAHSAGQPGTQAEVLTCHYCNYQRQTPKTCPACKGTRIRQYGTGTEKVEAEVQAIFPQARTLRWDHETTRQKGAHDLILSQFASQRANVLVGTQMIAKGLDLPLVTLVGVVLADVGLSLPDLRSAERTFQVLTQVAGRAGRSLLGGQVIMQTFQPEHYVIQAAARHDYDAFYRREIELRRQMGYPPFAQLVRLEFRHSQAPRAEGAAQALARQVKEWLAEGSYHVTEIIGPAPCFFARLSGLYRWQIILRGPNPAAVLRGRSLPDWRIEVNPPSLL
ncbi:MAG TPA: primosomal protein N' [Anaerolineales bacterium]|nr:primosomal protein N' [Anaerolineales bacterium]